MVGREMCVARVFSYSCFLFLSLAISNLSVASTSTGGVCEKKCLLQTVDNVIHALSEHKHGALKVSAHAEVRENGHLVEVDSTAWSQVKTIKSNISFADELSNNVVSRAGVVLEDGRPAYISTRLKITNGVIIDVELSSDTSDKVVAEYVFGLDLNMFAELPAKQRRTRDELETLARRYFQNLTDHDPLESDFSQSCDRFHSGQKITNVTTNSVEEGGPRSCYDSIAGNPPWGPATSQRFPVIDPARGVVLGITLLRTGNGGLPMYVSEIFRIVDGRIDNIDNIGLLIDANSLGFEH